MPLLFALLIFGGLWLQGSAIQHRFKGLRTDLPLAPYLALVPFWFAFWLLHLLLEPGLAYRVLSILFTFFGLFSLWYLRYTFVAFRLRGRDIWPYLLLFAPLLVIGVRVAGPPVLSDGLKHYLPSVEWLFYRGLDFNPFLTRYTTMPQAGEYLYSLVWGPGGHAAVRWLDALFAFQMQALLFEAFRRNLNRHLALLLALGLYFLPHSIFWIFGQGKIDALSIGATAAGLFLLLGSERREKPWLVGLMLALPLAIKYTNWVLLVVPWLIFLVDGLVKGQFRKYFLLALLPGFFLGPVLLRNQLLTNNPLAPLLPVQNPKVFVHTHGMSKELRTLESADNPEERRVVEHDLYLRRKRWKRWFWMGSTALALAFMWGHWRDPNRWYWVILPFLTLYFYASKIGPGWFVPRFILPLAVLFFNLFAVLLQKFLEILKVPLIRLVPFTVLLSTFLLGKELPQQWAARESVVLNERVNWQWYWQRKKALFAFSARLAQSEEKRERIFHTFKPAPGFFSYQEWQHLPTDRQVVENRKQDLNAILKYDYLTINSLSEERLKLLLQGRYEEEWRLGEYALWRIQ